MAAADRQAATMLAFVDVNGALRGKTYSAAGFEAIGEHGAPLTDLLLAVDPEDEPIVSFSRIGIRAGAGDLLIVPLVDSHRPLPWTKGSELCLGELRWADGSPCDLSARQVLVEALARLDALSLRGIAAFEYEVRIRDLDTGAPVTGPQSYSIEGAESIAELATMLVDAAAQMGVRVDAVHTEAGPGLIEVNTGAADALQAADDAIYLRHAVRGIARSLGLAASFLAKPAADEEGSSGHVHLSLWDGERNALLGDGSAAGPSERFRFAAGGVLAHLPAASLLMNPNLNSYKRLVPNFFAPVNCSWGIENRTAAVRGILAGTNTRLEVRRPGADANPYLALAAIVCAVSDGLERSISPPEPIVGDAGPSGEEAPPTLPASLESALLAFEDDARFRELLGTEFSAYFEATRRWELGAWQRAVTAWEVERYRLIS